LLLLLVLQLWESIQTTRSTVSLDKDDSHPAGQEIPPSLCSPAPAIGLCPEPNLFRPYLLHPVISQEPTNSVSETSPLCTETHSSLCLDCASISSCHQGMATMCFSVIYLRTMHFAYEYTQNKIYLKKLSNAAEGTC